MTLNKEIYADPYYETQKLFDVKRKTCHRHSKTVKPMLPNKLLSGEKIILVENEKIITDDKEMVKSFK